MFTRTALRLAVTAVLLTAAARAADDDEIPLAKVPAAVCKAADKAAPKVKWETAYKDTEDGVVVYTLQGENAKEKTVTVEVTAAGEVREVATEIDPADVPAKVLAALKKKFPRFKYDPEDVEEVVRKGKLAGYRFDGRRPTDTEDVSIFVSADGKTVEIEE